MPQPDHVSGLPVPDPETLDDDLKALFARCVDKLGIVPNVLRAYSLRPQKLRNFIAMYNELMLAPSGLTKLEREMVAVVVSSANRCYYCLVAHGQAVRQLSGDPELGEMLAMNYRIA
ncbi:MAG TPA: peroxidase-related enzyme, partial [Stellaceae bacterium]|nr:peroxidase-related enzyme [Stellaceae bacterium]